MATIKKYNGSTWENAVVRKYGTASDIITPPTTIYADGTAITTYTIKGNTVQNGTPTPSNPVEVNGVGNKTANLFNVNAIGNIYPNPPTTIQRVGLVVNNLDTNNDYYISINNPSQIQIFYARFDGETRLDTSALSTTANVLIPMTGANAIRFWVSEGDSWSNITNIMLSKGSTAQSYEPYGYKIPISSGGVTTPIYLTELLMKIGDIVDSLASSGTVTYNIAKYEFTGQETWYVTTSGSNTRAFVQNFSATIGESVALCDRFAYTDTSRNYPPLGKFSITSAKAIIFGVDGNEYADATAWKAYVSAQYAAGTPLTIWYQLATPSTETVTAPSIPTTDGANSITVDTTVQPSEFTATWTGWHDASVKEKSENLFDKDDSDILIGYEISSSGIIENSDWFVSGYIPVEYGVTYCKNYNNGGRLLFYDSAKTELGNALFYSDNTYTVINNNIKYIRINNTISAINTYMLNTGSTALPYEPYWK